ncbi:transcription factor GTE7-like [Panicum miliaceum]|uniref:Transcription factor GTE7-like n=1 Tax=Panicum miliaceum TaxID=4540 RepID=A0A3L6RGR8_PANMI|nr:transcription factor GTE7-like [Panicum miliaceum]
MHPPDPLLSPTSPSPTHPREATDASGAVRIARCRSQPAMTSAVLTGRNEIHHAHPHHHRHWGGARVPLMPKPSSNPNPRRHRAAAPANPIPGGPPTPPRAVPAAPDPEPSSSGHVKFRPSEMTPAEARQLRARLAGELGRVRALLSRVDAWQDGQRRRRAADSRPEEEPQPRARGESPPPPPPALVEAMRRRCAEILVRLRKSKNSVWFNSPVDVEGLKLHDYHAIIRSPMDLGTVKRNLAAGRYPSHEAFASDVRLTFSNAARYNPPDHHVHRYAGSLLATFEGLYREAVSWFEQQRQRQPVKPPMPLDLPPPPQPVSVPVQAPPRMGAAGRRAKPKARELNKREMDEEEKQKLRVEIENLPEEKMVNVLQIVQKRNSDLALTGEVVELDFDELDTETLWELDRFVVNWRKALKKNQRNSVMNGDAAVMNGDAIDVTVVVPDEDDMVRVDVNPPMMVETGDSVWHAEATTWLVFLLILWRLYCGLLLILFLLLNAGD